jgi:DNA-binding transcriptional MerR regulator
MSQKDTKNPDPLFTRGDVAKILNVTPLTIANREKSKKYPEARRDLNRYRIYSINDVLNLQLITFSRLEPNKIISVLHDKGYRDFKEISKIIDGALSKRTGASS